MLTWHTVFTKPQQEARAAIELTNQASNFSDGFMVRFPLFRSEKVRKGKIQAITEPLFPRYIFALFDRESDKWGCIRNTRGVSDIICNGNRPVVIRNEVMAAIMAYEAPVAPIPVDQVYLLHQPVKVVGGILNGLEGLFEGSNRHRTKAFLEILGKRIEVPMDNIAAA